MDEATRKEASREWGERHAREGEVITNPDGVSKEYVEGHRRGSLGFGSNVTPRKFGRGRDTPQDWTCICKHENRKWYSKCEMCGTPKALAEEAQSIPD